MADNHHHRHQHRPNRLLVPSRSVTFTAPTTPSRLHPLYPYQSSTPSKQRLSSFSSTRSSRSSLSSLFLLLFSLRSLYSLFPFLRSSPSSFSLFPFSFLVSLLSLLLTISFSFFSSSHPRNPSLRPHHQPFFSLSSITPTQHKLLISKSTLLAVLFLLRFQALRYCGAAAMILAELSGNVAARFVIERWKQVFNPSRSSKVRGFFALLLGLFLLTISWDRIDCFPFSSFVLEKWGFLMFPKRNCVRIWPLLLPFLSGFLGTYERVSTNWVQIRELGKKRVRLVSLFYTTAMLFIPAIMSMFVFEANGDDVSIKDLGWPLANTVVFGVLLSENYSDEKFTSSKDFHVEFLITFVCMVFWELFYFPELSLWGLLLCGLLLYIAVRELDPLYLSNLELGADSSDSFTTSIMKPIRHILSERKSRKIALFLLINTAYMFVEFVAGFMSNSLGLISDACHMLFDCAALAIGLYASYISRLPANSQFNYGRGRFEVLSGYVNAVFLVLVGALIVLESIERILDPQEISTSSLLVVSIGGLLVNMIGLVFFHEEHHHAHGGSCSHSHSDSHAHSHAHHHHHGNHDNKCHDKHDGIIPVSHDHQEHHHHNHSDHGIIFVSRDHHGHHCPDHIHQHGQCDHVEQHSHHHENSHPHGHDDHHQAHSHFQGHSAGKETKGHKNHHMDHNMEGIFLHVLADTMGSVGVVISTLLIKYKGWLAADPACSIFISVLIVSSVIPLLRNCVEILLQRVPRAHEKDLREALKSIMKIEGVYGIQNLHAWSFTNTDVVGTLHLHVSTDIDKAFPKAQVSQLLHNAGIKDLTLQVESVGSLT